MQFRITVDRKDRQKAATVVYKTVEDCKAGVNAQLPDTMAVMPWTNNADGLYFSKDGGDIHIKVEVLDLWHSLSKTWYKNRTHKDRSPFRDQG